MANKPKKYDLKAADRRRSRWIQVGLTAIVIAFAVGLFLVIIKPWESGVSGPPAGDARPVVVSVPEKLVKNPDGKPKVVLSLYEDFLCPGCAGFESKMGSTVRQLVDSGAVQAEYFLVALQMHDTNQTDYYASRAGGAAYCVAEADPSPSKDAFRRFHAALFAQQPTGATGYPDNAQLIETARVAGVASQSLSDCINKGKYDKMVQGMVQATNIEGTPTVRINGDDFAITDQTTPQTLIDAVTQITGPVPGLSAPVPAPAPAPVPAGP